MSVCVHVVAYCSTVSFPEVHADVSCPYTGEDIHPFAFRVHAHTLGEHDNMYTHAQSFMQDKTFSSHTFWWHVNSCGCEPVEMCFVT